MLLTVNIGNTNISLGIFDGDNILESWKVRTHAVTVKILSEEFKRLNIPVRLIESIIIGSVVPSITPIVIKFIKKNFSAVPLIVNQDLKFPIELNIEQKGEVGADIIANLVAANALYKKPLIVVDSGTATTFCVLSKNRKFTGAVISTGLSLMAEVLHERSELLPGISIVKPLALIGKNTVDCMQSGIYWGYVGLVKEIVGRMKKEVKVSKVIATGGNITLVEKNLPCIDEVNEKLTLIGLRIIYEFNKSLV